jgi:hypothetical protein
MKLFGTRKIINESKVAYQSRALLEEDLLNNLYIYLYDNIWYDYFLNLYEDDAILGDNWIDFEMEISEIIQWMNTNCNQMNEKFKIAYERMIDKRVGTAKTVIFYQCCDFAKGELANKTVESFLNCLYEDLERITMALEIYLVYFVEKIEIKPLDLVDDINPDYVISFNYTHTFQRLYNKYTPVCYIHGECSEEKGTNNMVLGIDEYLDDSEKDCNTNYCIFKKFIMRIRKKDGIEYQNWCREIENKHRRHQKLVERDNHYFNEDISEVYIYGHSLDKTDKDVLEKFLRPEYTSIHLYAKDKVDEGKLLSNLVQIVTEDVLIKKASMEKTRLTTVVI